MTWEQLDRWLIFWTVTATIALAIYGCAVYASVQGNLVIHDGPDRATISCKDHSDPKVKTLYVQSGNWVVVDCGKEQTGETK